MFCFFFFFFEEMSFQPTIISYKPSRIFSLPYFVSGIMYLWYCFKNIVTVWFPTDLRRENRLLNSSFYYFLIFLSLSLPSFILTPLIFPYDFKGIQVVLILVPFYPILLTCFGSWYSSYCDKIITFSIVVLLFEYNHIFFLFKDHC